VGFVDGGVTEFGEHVDQELAVDFVVFGNEEGERVFFREIAVMRGDLFGRGPAMRGTRALGETVSAGKGGWQEGRCGFGY